MLEQDLRTFKVYYERANRRKAFKEIKVTDKSQVYAEFIKQFPGRRILDIVPVITNPQ
jgi:hypothetical protein